MTTTITTTVVVAWMLLCQLWTHVDGSSGSAPLNVDVSMVTYLGDGSASGVNTGTDTAVDTSGNVYVTGAGSFNFGLTPQGDASADGYILKLSNNLQPTEIFRMGSQVASIEVRETSSGRRLMVRSNLGVAILDGSFQQQYTVDNCGVSNCLADLGRDGTLAVLQLTSDTLQVVTNGQVSASLDLSNRQYKDIAVDPVNHRVIVAYFYQSRPHGVPVQVPCIFAYDYSLQNQIWKSYCVSGEEDYQTHNMADSRANHLYYNDVDDKLYLAGYTDGGNSIFRYNPLDIRQNSGSLQGLSIMASGVLPHYDNYVQTSNMHGARSISFLARLNPADGSVEQGQFVLARLSSGSGNSVSTADIAAGAGGTVVAAQSAAASIERRDTQTVNGQDTASYGGGDGVLLVVSADFSRRLVWTQFQKTSGHSNGVAVAANDVNGSTRVAFLAKSRDSEFLQVSPLTGTGPSSSATTDQFVLVVTDV